MGWRNVFVGSPAQLSKDKNRLVVKQKERVTIPLNDIDTLVLDSPQITLSSALLGALGEYQIAVFVTGENHHPVGTFLPFHPHSRQPLITRRQMNWTRAFQKRCWEKIVRQKILNQALCLELSGKPGVRELESWAALVRTGDPENREGTAASLYFSRLWGPSFHRRKENRINQALNYGYTIFRAALARTISAYGFIPCLGLHHHSELNAFNLADDMIEPFRPVVDLFVDANIVGKEGTGLEKEDRALLVSLLGADIQMEGEVRSVMNGIDRMTASLQTATEAKDPRLLKVPQLIPFQIHRNE